MQIAIHVSPKPNKLMRKEQLTGREKEVLYMIAFELSSKEIAERLGLGVETVKSHRKNIMVKLDVTNTAGMIRAAFEQGIINLEDLQ